MTTTVGFDVSTFPDLDPTFTLIDGRQVLAEAILRRLTTPRGGLFYDSDYGLDVRAWLNESFIPKQLYLLRAQVEAECEKDERIASASADLSFVQEAHALSVIIALETRDDTFSLTLAIDQVSARILAAD